MKTSKFNSRYVTAVAIASFAALVSACGSSNGSSAVAPGIGVGGIGVGSTCAILSQQMSFSGYAAYLDSANIYAGQQYGSQLGLGQGGASSGNQLINTVMPPVDQYAPRTTSDLSYMGMNITSTGGYGGGYGGSYGGGYPTTGVPYTGTYPTGGYPSTGTQTQTMVQGSFVFSAADWAYLTSMFQSYGGGAYPYGGYPTTGMTTLQNIQACNLSINSGIYSWNTGQGQGTLYGGYITMTVNGQLLTFKI